MAPGKQAELVLKAWLETGRFWIYATQRRSVSPHHPASPRCPAIIGSTTRVGRARHIGFRRKVFCWPSNGGMK
jgi:hypothetical protein